MSDAETAELMDPDKVELAIPEAGLPTDPRVLGILYFQAMKAQQLVNRIKDHTKEILENGGKVEGLFLGKGTTSTSITDAKTALEILRHELGEVSAEEFLKCCKVSLPSLEQIHHLKSKGGTIQSNKKACRELLAPVCEQSTGKRSIKFSKPENRQ